MVQKVTPHEADRVLRARREHSKGDGNVPSAEPHQKLIDERPEDRGRTAATPIERARPRPNARRSSSAKRKAARARR